MRDIMSTETKNNFMNFLYRFFLEDDKGEGRPLSVESKDKLEAELAKSLEKIEQKHNNTSGKGNSKFKVEESKLSKNSAHKASKETLGKGLGERE